MLKLNDNAVSEVVGFVMIIGICVVALSMYMMYEIPAQGREGEISHMNDIKDDFTSYKQTLDSLWINAMGALNVRELSKGYNVASAYGVEIGTSFALGTMTGTYVSGDMFSFFTPVASGGELSVNSSDGSITVSAVDKSGTMQTLYTGNLGSLSYKSHNSYWVDQEYYYKFGGVFLRQNTGTSLRLSPLISIYGVNSTEDGLFAAVQLIPVSISGSQSVTSSGIVMVDTRLRESKQYVEGTQLVRSVTVEIKSSTVSEAKLWKRIIEEILAREQTLSWCEVTLDGTTVKLVVYGPSGKVDLDSDELDVKLNLFNADYKVTLQNVAYGVA